MAETNQTELKVFVRTEDYEQWRREVYIPALLAYYARMAANLQAQQPCDVPPCGANWTCVGPLGSPEAEQATHGRDFIVSARTSLSEHAAR